MKQIYFLLLLFLTGMIQAQTQAYQYDQTGNRTGRTVPASAPATVQPAQASPQESTVQKNYALKTGNGEIIYELPRAIELLPTGFQPLVHTEAVLPDAEPLNEDPIHIQPAVASTSINTQKEVGEIPISSSVQNGSITYTVPVDIYLGRNGFQPEISLAYNSMAGNGVAGYGWNIGGLSSIIPVHSNYYFDGANAQPETMGVNAGYALDGMALRRTAANQYQSEQGHIMATIQDNSNKYYFSVTFPDGKQATYGFKDSTTPQAVYPLTEIRDLTGNFMRYTYLKDGNDYYVTEIVYGFHSTTIGKITFGYTSRTDKPKGYRGGKLIQLTRLLSNIRVYHNNELLRTYTTTYKYNKVNLLKTISCKAGNSELNPLTFSYDAEQNLTGSFSNSDGLLLTYFNTTNQKINFQRYKESNSKASEGLIAWPDFPTYDVLRYNTKGECEYGSRYPADQNLLLYKEVGYETYSPVKIQAKANFAGVLVMDHLGTGKDAVFTLNYKYNNSASSLSITNHSTTTPSTSIKSLRGYIKEGSYLSPAPRVFLTGDFMGDGKVKLLTISGHKTPQGKTQGTLDSYITMIDVSTSATLYDAYVFKFDISQDRLVTIDFNGDGRTDLCHITPTGTNIYSYIGNKFVRIASNGSLTSTKISSGKTNCLLTGDINGDGKTDFLVAPKPTIPQTRAKHVGECKGGCKGKKISTSADGTIETWQYGSDICYIYPGQTETIYPPGTYAWTIYTSTGSGFTVESADLSIRNDSSWEFLLYDVNGDNMPDLVTKIGSRIAVYLNQNGKFSSSEEAARTVAAKTEILPGVATTSWSSENRLSSLFVINNATVSILKLNRNDGQRRKISSVVNSLGVTQKVFYKSMGDATVYRTEGTPVSAIHHPLILNESLVSSVETWCNNIKVADHAYQYTNSQYHPQGIGFCGFEKITVTDRLRGNNTVYTYTFPKQGVVSYISSPEQLVSFQYNHQTGPYKLLTLNVKQQEVVDCFTANTVRTGYLYDNYGNISQQTVQYVYTPNKEVTNYTYNYTHSKRELSKAVTTINGTWKEEMSITSVNAATRQPQTIIRTVNGNKLSETNHTWQNGNLVQTSEKQFNSATTHTTVYTVDTYGRVKTVKNPLGLSTTYTYNSKGELDNVQDHKLQKTVYAYDDFGRVKQITYPDGVKETTQRVWGSSPAGAIYKVTRSTTGQPAAATFFDALGRQVRTGMERFNNTWIYTDYTYNNRGLLIKETLPFKTSPLATGITYAYDTYDRLTQVSHPTGRTTRITYNNHKTTTVQNGISTVRTVDHMDRLAAVTDPAGTISYEYTVTGQISKANLPNGKSLTTVYDSYGRVASQTDPNTGTTTYTYDTNTGNLVKTVDAANRITQYTYDTYNRILTEKIADITITYQYEGDLLVKKSSNQGSSIEYTYDVLKRLTKIRENAPDGKWLQQELTYENGNIKSIKYTSQSGVITTVNNQYAQGHLTEQKLNNQTSFFKLTAENNLGLPTAVTTAGVNRTYGYTDYGMLSSRSAKNSTTTLQNLSYGINAAKGVMDWRKDNGRNKEERFTYDNLNRLTNFAVGTVAYDVQGNITSKSNAGNYQYTAGRPNAVTQINSAKASIPARNQTVDYYGFNRPKSITENGYTATLSYNVNFDRNKMHLTKNGTRQLTRYYLGGCYEIDETGTGSIKEKLYLGGDYYTAPAVYVRENGGSWGLYNICRDHQGSITHITGSSGSPVKEELSYDAWGCLRNPATQTNYAPDSEPALFLGRGYTGHEHLPWFGLINMNARLYDPALGRFLAPDPYVQAPDFTQNYNRYTYYINNPLMYTDPDGELAWFIIPIGVAIIAGSINVAVNWKNIDGFAQGLTTFAVGAGAGFATAASAGAGAGVWAVSGIAAAGGAATAANSSIVQQTGHNFSGFGDVNWGHVGIGSLAGGAAGFFGGVGAHYGAQVLGGIAVNGTSISSPVLSNSIRQGIGGAAGGFAGGFGSGLILTGDVNQAFKFGGNGAFIGLGTGLATGAISGYAYARQKGLNPWTGKSNFFDDSFYSSKVLEQMGNANDKFHGFPKSVDGYAGEYGKFTIEKGGDGNIYHWLRLNGTYNGRTGNFEYTKDLNGKINHRLFKY